MNYVLYTLSLRSWCDSHTVMSSARLTMGSEHHGPDMTDLGVIGQRHEWLKPPGIRQGNMQSEIK